MGDGHFYGEQFGNQYNEPIYGYQGCGFFGGLHGFEEPRIVHHIPDYSFNYGVYLDDLFFGPADFSRSDESFGGTTNSQYQINQPQSYQHVRFSAPHHPFYR